MANNPPATAERDRIQDSNLNDPPRYGSSPRSSGVSVFDRPATTQPTSSNAFGTILAVLVILILAYFVFQWLF